VRQRPAHQQRSRPGPRPRHPPARLGHPGPTPSASSRRPPRGHQRQHCFHRSRCCATRATRPISRPSGDNEPSPHCIIVTIMPHPATAQAREPPPTTSGGVAGQERGGLRGPRQEGCGPAAESSTGPPAAITPMPGRAAGPTSSGGRAGVTVAGARQQRKVATPRPEGAPPELQLPQREHFPPDRPPAARPTA
jgi:hypothetical protein